MSFDHNILQIDPEVEVERICTFIYDQVKALKRHGVVIGLSGGVDSALCSSICVKTLGKENVLGLILPEEESNPISAEYAIKHADLLGINTKIENITSTLRGFGTYEKRDNAIKQVFPEYNHTYKSKIILPKELLTKDALNYFTLKIQDSHTNIKTARLNNQNLRQIVAATNTKQVIRMMYLNYYSELENYLVCGTTNRTEYIQGFFVKYGDGGVDFEPIAHLYKMQVYQLAEYLEVIPEIVERAPSPDTFSFAVTDEEMYFRMPYDTLDYLLYAWENGVPVAQVCESMNLSEQQVKRAFRDFTSKYNTTVILRLPPLTLRNEAKT